LYQGFAYFLIGRKGICSLPAWIGNHKENIWEWDWNLGKKMASEMGFGQNIGWAGPSKSHFRFESLDFLRAFPLVHVFPLFRLLVYNRF